MTPNERPPTAENGEGPESAATVNRCTQDCNTIILMKRDRCAVSVQDVVGEGGATVNTYPTDETIRERAPGYGPSVDTPPLCLDTSVRLDILSSEPFTVVEIYDTRVLLRHVHGWTIDVPKWRVSIMVG